MSEPPLPESDFSFKIDFQRGTGSASRVFLAAQAMVEAMERVDADLIRCVDSGINPILVLEDIQAGSMRVFLRNALEAVDDDALKHLDWRQAVGSFLVKAKYATLRWANSPDAPQRLPQIRAEIQQIATETDIRQLPDYSPPAPATLVRALQDLQVAKGRLSPGDRLFFDSGEGTLEVDLGIGWTRDEIEDLAVARVLEHPTEMILAVKKPDYLGSSQWDFRHGRRSISAPIEDADWLRRFQQREIDVRPGDALRCKAMVEMLYGHDNELISERHRVLEVVEVLRDRVHQPDLDFGG